MIIKRFKVPIYRWRVEVIDLKDYDDKELIMNKLRRYKFSEEDYEEISEKIDKGAYNGGTTYYNSSELLCIILLYKHKSIMEKVETLLHEGRHVTDEILKIHNIDDIEAAAYLQGFIDMSLIKEYIGNKDCINS